MIKTEKKLGFLSRVVNVLEFAEFLIYQKRHRSGPFIKVESSSDRFAHDHGYFIHYFSLT